MSHISGYSNVSPQNQIVQLAWNHSRNISMHYFIVLIIVDSFLHGHTFPNISKSLNGFG